MKVNKVEDKPMVIHTKKKPKIHIHESKKGENTGKKVYTVRRGPKINGTDMVKGDIRNNKTSSLITGVMDKREKSSVKISKRKEDFVKLAGRAGASVAADQMEGGEELKQSALTAYELSRPAAITISKGADLLKEKAFEQRFKKIKAVKNSKKVPKKTAKNTVKAVGKKSVSEASKTAGKKAAKVVVKKTAENAGTVAGTAVTGAAGPLIGKAAGDAVGAKMDIADVKHTARNRKIRYFVDKMNAEEKQKDSVEKLIRDLTVNRGGLIVKRVAMAAGSLLISLIGLIAMTVLPVLLVIAIIYNSPFALFFPSLQDTGTVQSVTSAYVAEFYDEINTLAGEHTGYDAGEILYVGEEGTSAAPSNDRDIMCVYMVRYGIGDTASIMNEQSKRWLKAVVEDMCSYETSEEAEVIQGADGKMATKTILQVNVTLKDYQDMIKEYDFDAEQTELIEQMMNFGSADEE